ncbi:MAG: hypothetical protein A4E53_04564 [Pelotomaculum sp. PtaB.Bin104]|nr:MAG: hypothetical protein A4E53_04564 [Pelotomaculum sp. PtaB.Bin104]
MKLEKRSKNNGPKTLWFLPDLFKYRSIYGKINIRLIIFVNDLWCD